MNFLQYRRHGGVAGRRDKLYVDLKAVVADADELLQEIGNATEEEIAVARGRIEQRLHAARTAIEDARTVVSRNVRHAAVVTQDYAMENPWKAFGLPAVAALVVFALLSRR
jgi:ElaB/YqjD/DUF883 family membrane-anchored ribosome-binding protein